MNKKERGSLSVAPDAAATAQALVDCKDDCITDCKDLQEEVNGKFDAYKKLSVKLSDIYKAVFPGSLRPYRVADCASYLEYWVTDAGTKLHDANFCRDRLCPMCNWRRSLKIFAQTSQIMDVLDASSYKFVFLTLTVKNCKGAELPAVVDKLYVGWRYLYNKCPRVRKAVEGSFRALEVTRNHRTDTYHPHLHVVFAVRPNYFGCRDYISQREWSHMWRDILGLDYVPITDVRRTYGDAAKSVAEISKYAVKSKDYLSWDYDTNLRIVRDYLAALTGRRLCGYTGCFARARKMLNLDDPEDGDLVLVDGQELRPDLALMVVRYRWCMGAYHVADVERPQLD